MFGWMRDPVVAENVGVRSEPSLERTLAWIEHARAAADVDAFAIVAAGEHVGNVVLDRIDAYLGTARLSIYLGEARARGRGIASAAMRLALRHAFSALGLRKVWLTVHARNGTAIAAYARLGFSVEGVLRDEFVLGGERLPALYMGLLRSEFVSGPPRATPG
jgi:RimJ/RimL family protein N-acetyltransferase